VSAGLRQTDNHVDAKNGHSSCEEEEDQLSPLPMLSPLGSPANIFRLSVARPDPEVRKRAENESGCWGDALISVYARVSGIRACMYVNNYILDLSA
jgi:hypothetical protein